MKTIFEKLKDNKKYFIKLFIITFIWGLITHGYMFLNNNLTHDSLMESVATESMISWKFSLGRIFYAPYIFLTRGALTQPWLIGILSLIYLAISSILILKIFKVREENNWLNILIPGVLTANITVISLCGTYIHDMDVDMFALLMSILSVYLWRNFKHGYLYGIIPLLISIGLYQSYISVTLVLIMFLSIIDLLNKNDYKKILKQGIQSICMIIITGLIYFCLLKLVPIIFDVEILSNNYNSVDTFTTMRFIDIVKQVINTYISTIKNILLPTSIYNNIFVIILHIMLMLSAAYVGIIKLIDNKIKILSKILIIILVLLMPLAMEICKVLTNGMSHTLMIYATSLTYIFVLLLLNEYKYDKLKILSIIIILVVFIGNIRMANTLYILKDTSKEITEHYLNRVLYSIESYESYIPEKTKVLFVGYPNIKKSFNSATDNLRDLAGASNEFSLMTIDASRYNFYFKNILNTNVNVIEKPTDNESFDEIIENMPIYPNKESIQLFDDVLIVKLG